ncbi:pantetheine-phosphate adenylyltransferase [bacterium]|nr:pantetheine-phosphate adenylyltransferase [bacterium]
MMSKAIYAGSFDPITNGHIDIVKRAQKLFDEVTIGVIQNPDKKSLFTVDERIKLIQEVLPSDISVEGFEGLLVEYARNKNVYTIIRGLRAVSDFDFEFQMALTNRNLDPKIDTVFLMTDVKYSYLSSSIVKQLAGLNANVSDLVQAPVEKALKEKLSNG